MVYQVPASKASIKQNRFEFEVPQAGRAKPKKFSLPKMQYLNADITSRMTIHGAEIAKAQKTGEDPSPDVQAEFAKLQREIFDQYAPGLYELVDMDQLNELQEAWQEASGVSLGESSGSAD